jgi:hypothetical protein
VDVDVVGLGAWCDYVTDEEQRERWLDGTVEANPRPSGDTGTGTRRMDQPPQTQTLHFRVEEFAALSDGRRLTLTDDRGWSVQGRGLATDDPWAYLTAEAVETDVRTVVLPDDAEATGDEHPWAWLTARLGALGVETTPAGLRRLPYDVVLSRRLRARLGLTAERPPP